MNYFVSNGRTTVNIDADVNTSLSTQSAPVATAVRCDYTNEDITAVCDAFANTFATYADIKPSADSEEKHKKGIAYAIPFVVCVILSLFTNLLLLLSKAKLLDKCSVTLDILALKVCEKVSSLTNHLKKTSS